MNKAELVEALAQHYDGSKADATKALNAVVHTVSATTAAGERVAITGFGVFERVQRPARTVRNPRTGERLQAPATAVPRFRPGTELKAYVAGSRPVPELVVPATPARRSPTRALESEPEAPLGRAADASPVRQDAPGKSKKADKADAKKASPATKANPAKKASPAEKASSAKMASPAKKNSSAKLASPAKKDSLAKKAAPAKKEKGSGKKDTKAKSKKS